MPIEAYYSIGLVERYHRPLHRAYNIIKTEVDGIDKAMALQIAFKALNNSTSLNSLVPTLLVYGTYLRIVEIDALSPTVTQRAAALKKAMNEVKKLYAER